MPDDTPLGFEEELERRFARRLALKRGIRNARNEERALGDAHLADQDALERDQAQVEEDWQQVSQDWQQVWDSTPVSYRTPHPRTRANPPVPRDLKLLLAVLAAWATVMAVLFLGLFIWVHC